MEARQHLMRRKNHCSRDSLYAVLLPWTTCAKLYRCVESLKEEDFERRSASNQTDPIKALSVTGLGYSKQRWAFSRSVLRAQITISSK
jgi:hypothetical protein